MAPMTTPANQPSVWQEVACGLDKAFRQEPMIPRDYMAHYAQVYNYCTLSNAGSINTGIVDHISDEPIGRDMYEHLEAYVTDHLKVHLEKCQELRGESLLEYYTKLWEDYSFSSRVMDGICAYLNRHFIRREQDEGRTEIYMIYTLSLVLWKRIMFDPLETKIIAAAMELIRLDRTGEPTNSRLIRLLTDNLVALGSDDHEKDQKTELQVQLRYYKESFEKIFLEETRNFYTMESREFLDNGGSCIDYMIKVEQRIEQEDKRCLMCFNSSTQKELSAVYQDVLISKQIEFIQSHFGPLLVEQKDDHLARMFSLCTRVAGGLDALRAALERHVIQEGQGAMQKIEQEGFNDPKLYIKTLLEVHERYQDLVDKSFKKEAGFTASLDRAATDFVNNNAVTRRAPPNTQSLKSSELICRYTDQLFKKSAKMPDEMEMDALQAQVLVIFKYLEDKDVFLKFYTKMFAKRLINDLSASDEAEQCFIAKLTSCCGFEYTSRLTKMINDLQVSKDQTADFKEKYDSSADGKKAIDFNCLVLSSGSWPNFPEWPLVLPSQLSTTIENFTLFYAERFNGRRLTWCYSQCRGELNCSAFKGKKYVFTVSTAQMCALLLFNEQNEYTYEQMKMNTGMQPKVSQMVIQSLLANKVLKTDRALEKDEVPGDAVLSLNMAYTSKKVKVDLSKMTMKAEAAKDTEVVQKNADEDRKNVINACLVRIMKMRKTLKHSILISESIAQLQGRFKPKIEMVKKCIGMLIEKEYLKRSEEERDVYEYVA